MHSINALASVGQNYALPCAPVSFLLGFFASRLAFAFMSQPSLLAVYGMRRLGSCVAQNGCLTFLRRSPLVFVSSAPRASFFSFSGAAKAPPLDRRLCQNTRTHIRGAEHCSESASRFGGGADCSIAAPDVRGSDDDSGLSRKRSMTDRPCRVR